MFEEEEATYVLFSNLKWALPLILLAASVFDVLLMILYIKWLHPWKGILKEEVRGVTKKRCQNNSGAFFSGLEGNLGG